MREKSLFLLFISILFCFDLLAQPVYSADKLGVAVLDFEVQEGVPAAQGEAAYNLFKAEIVESKHFNVLERQRVEEIFKEMRLLLSDIMTTESAVEVGRMLKVQKLMLGSVGRFEDKPVIGVRLVDIEKGKVQEEKRLQLQSEQDFALGIKYLAHLVISAIPVEGRIIDVEGDIVRLDLGSEHGLKVGDRLIAQGEGREVKDLEGNVIGYERERLGHLRVIEVGELWSKAKRERRGLTGKLLFWRGKETQLEVSKDLQKGYVVRTIFDERLIQKERRRLEKVEILEKSFFLGGGGTFKPRERSFKEIYGETQVFKLSLHSGSHQYYNFLFGVHGSSVRAKAGDFIDSNARFDIATAVFGARVKYRLDLGQFLSVMPYLGIGANYSYVSEEIPSLREIWFGPGYETFWGLEVVYKHAIGLFMERAGNSTEVGPNDIEIGGKSVCFGLTIWH